MGIDEIISRVEIVEEVCSVAIVINISLKRLQSDHNVVGQVQFSTGFDELDLDGLEGGVEVERDQHQFEGRLALRDAVVLYFQALHLRPQLVHHFFLQLFLLPSCYVTVTLLH